MHFIYTHTHIYPLIETHSDTCVHTHSDTHTHIYSLICHSHTLTCSRTHIHLAYSDAHIYHTLTTHSSSQGFGKRPGRRRAFWEDGMAGSAKRWVGRSLGRGREPKSEGEGAVGHRVGARTMNGVGTAHAPPRACLWPGQLPFPALSQAPWAGFPGPAELGAWPKSPPLPSHYPLPSGGPIVRGSGGAESFLNHWHPTPQPTQAGSLQRSSGAGYCPKVWGSTTSQPSRAGGLGSPAHAHLLPPRHIHFHPHPWGYICHRLSLVWGKRSLSQQSISPGNVNHMCFTIKEQMNHLAQGRHPWGMQMLMN